MSLFKQIQTLITLLLLATLTIVLKINFDNAREFTARELFNSGKNIANVLALSLSSQPSDRVFMETCINAMFDGGSFEEISLLGSRDGTELFKRHEEIIVDGVPSLFIQLIDLQTPVAEAQVMDGWSILGTLQVKPHSGSSYLKLWETFKQLCLLFVLVGSVAIVISSLILRYLLQSLGSIRRQAEAISHNEFIINASIPGTPELKEVVTAMNTMVEKVQTIYNRQLEHLKNYQELNFKDTRTGLHNRKFIVKQLEHFLDSENGKTRGQVILLGFVGMDTMTISPEHTSLDSFYINLANVLKKESRAVADAVVAKLPRHEFACLLPNCNREKGLAIAKETVNHFRQLIARQPEFLDAVSVYGGVAPYDHGDDLSSVLSKTDYAFSMAKGGSSGTVEAFREDGSQAVLGKFEWKTMIEEALSQDRFFLTAQPVIAGTEELHKEVYIGLIDPQGVHHKAGYFMPMVITLGLAARLDQYVLERAAGYLFENPKGVLAVNITTEFCRDRRAFIWFRQFLAAGKSIAGHIVFEIHESTLVRYSDICLDLAGLVRGMGYELGIDQFSMSDRALALLKDLKPRYIKVEQGYLLDSEAPGAADVALNSLITITDSLDIKLIAVKIENEEQRLALTAKNINCFQGRNIADVAPLRV
ncbi:MAG: EAL domain-containing protein [Desulfobacteraceae bacterium]|nr:EAL domain-containing protein [Desulfobacteraceae bacterium]